MWTMNGSSAIGACEAVSPELEKHRRLITKVASECLPDPRNRHKWSENYFRIGVFKRVLVGEAPYGSPIVTAASEVLFIRKEIGYPHPEEGRVLTRMVWVNELHNIIVS